MAENLAPALEAIDPKEQAVIDAKALLAAAEAEVVTAKRALAANYLDAAVIVRLALGANIPGVPDGAEFRMSDDGLFHDATQTWFSKRYMDENLDLFSFEVKA